MPGPLMIVSQRTMFLPPYILTLYIDALQIRLIPLPRLEAKVSSTCCPVRSYPISLPHFTDGSCTSPLFSHDTVFLDHILYPTITDSGFVTEIFHINGKGEEAGVVMSEMQALEQNPNAVLARK